MLQLIAAAASKVARDEAQAQEMEEGPSHGKIHVAASPRQSAG